MIIKEGIHIVGTGRCLPANVVTNDDLSKIVDTNDEWISSRTGIKSRYFVDENQSNLDLATEAARMAILNAGIDKSELGAVVLATVKSDYLVPSMACMVQKRLDLPTDIPCFDINAACSGFMYGLQIARGLIMQNEKKYALVIGSETLSRIMDMTDRGSCILFGDGSGAAVIELTDSYEYVSVLGAEGNDEVLFCPNGNGDRLLSMLGSDVFKFAVSTVPKTINAILDKKNMTADDIDLFVCHQANIRIIESVAKRLKQDMSKFYVNVDRFGNTSSASIPIALSEMNDQGMLKKGMKIIAVGFGAGLTWGGAYLEW